MIKFGDIEILTPQCKIVSIHDGRGGIFTWIPKEPILEFNMLYFRPGKTRGDHYHPEFVEYFLVADGSGAMATKGTDGKKITYHASKGTCFRTPKNITHTFYAITECTCISMLTKPWDECSPPIVRDDSAAFAQGLENNNSKGDK